MAEVCIAAQNVTALDGGEITRLLQEAGFRVREVEGADGMNEAELASAMGGADAVMAGTERYSFRLLNRLPNLKLISRRGAGTDNVDLATAKKLGICVANTPGVTSAAVAELTMAMLLAADRQLPMHNAALHRGEWKKALASGLMGKTLGLAGFGGIAREVAQRAHAFGMRVLCNYRHRDKAAERQLGVQYATFDELLAESDYLSVHVPLTPETRGMFGAAEFARMKPEAVFVNTARGAVADEDALAAALQSGSIRGAAVDVYSEEPCAHSPLMACENAILTPHIGSFTRQTFAQMNRMCAENIIAFFRDGTCCHLVG